MPRFYKRKSGGFKRKPKKSMGKRLYNGAMKGLNMARLAGQTAKIIQSLNVEKKYQNFSQINQPFGVVNGASDAFFSENITPVLTQNVTGSGRTGNSVKLTSVVFQLRVASQSSTSDAFKYKWYIVCKPDCGTATATATVATQCFDANPFNGRFDYHVNRDPEQFRNYRILRQGKGTLQADQLSGQTALNQATIPIKLNHRLRYESDGTTTPVTNNMYLIIFADSGDVAANTAALVSYACRFYYVDN